MRGRLAPVEQSGLGQDQRAGTDRAQAPHPGFGGPQPVEQSLVAPLRIHADATGDQQGIQRDGSAFGPAGIRHQLQPRRGGDRTGRGAQQHQLVMTGQTLALALDVGRGEYLHRAGDVQAHHFRVDQAGDGADGVHDAALRVDGCSLLPVRACRNDKVPTDLANACHGLVIRDPHRCCKWPLVATWASGVAALDPRPILPRRHADDRLEVMNEVRLVAVTTAQCGIE